MKDIIATKGDTIIFDVYVTRGEDPVDLTGGKVWFTVKRNSRDLDEDSLIYLNSAVDPAQVRIIAPATNGQIRVELEPADTVDIKDTYLPYDVQIRESDGAISTIEYGTIELRKNVTQSVA